VDDGRDTQARLDREQQFHDHAFAHGSRQRTAKFYAVTDRGEAWYAAQLDRVTSGHVLEYGCGQGSQAFRLAQRGLKVTAIDISAEAIRQTKVEAERLGLIDRIQALRMDAEQLGLADHTFDLVCGSGILHHLKLSQAFAEVARVLKPSGVAVFVEPLGHNPLISAYRRLTPSLRTADEHPLVMGDLAAARGWFTEVQTWFFVLVTLAAVPLRRWHRFDQVVERLGRVDDWLFRRLPALRRHAWYCVMRFSGPRVRQTRSAAAERQAPFTVGEAAHGGGDVPDPPP
jgi:ubiquinone/menaquinone biosynthesis C-methylase UbiE